MLPAPSLIDVCFALLARAPHSFFLPDIRRDEYAAKAKQLLEMFVDRDAYNFMPSAVAALNEQGRGKSSKVVPLKTEGDGNCLPRAISRGSTLWPHAHLDG